MSDKIAIKVEDLTIAYNHTPVLWYIDLTVQKGVLMAIVGPNGAGKSTLIKSMLGFLTPVSGNVLFLENHTLLSEKGLPMFLKKEVWIGIFRQTSSML